MSLLTLSHKPEAVISVSATMTSRVFSLSKTIPRGFPVRWPSPPPADCGLPVSASVRYILCSPQLYWCFFRRYLGVPEELQKWFRGLFPNLERHPSPDWAVFACFKGPVALSFRNGGVSSLHEATFSATVKLLRVFAVANPQGLTSPFTGCSENHCYEHSPRARKVSIKFVRGCQIAQSKLLCHPRLWFKTCRRIITRPFENERGKHHALWKTPTP